MPQDRVDRHYPFMAVFMGALVWALLGWAASRELFTRH